MTLPNNPKAEVPNMNKPKRIVLGEGYPQWLYKDACSWPHSVSLVLLEQTCHVTIFHDIGLTMPEDLSCKKIRLIAEVLE